MKGDKRQKRNVYENGEERGGGGGRRGGGETRIIGLRTKRKEGKKKDVK